jgi:hypothetical protein
MTPCLEQPQHERDIVGDWPAATGPVNELEPLLAQLTPLDAA